MKKTPGTDGAWGLLCVAMLRNENEQVQQPWQIRQVSNLFVQIPRLNRDYLFQDGCNLMTQCDMSKLETSDLADASHMFYRCDSLTTIGDLSGWNTSSLTNASSMFSYCSRLSVNCSNWDVSKVTNHSNFNTNAPGVILPSAWQTSSDEGVEDSTIAPLCEEQGNRDALRVSDENGNDKAVSKTDGETSADSETEGSNTASATDEAGAKEETSDDIVQEETAAA